MNKLYNNFQKGYETAMISYIDNVVRKLVGDFPNDAFWKQRGQRGEQMRVAINEKLASVFAECVSLQIIQVELSAAREESLIKT